MAMLLASALVVGAVVVATVSSDASNSVGKAQPKVWDGCKVAPEVPEEVTVALGFIGYYVNDGNVISTSPFWLYLKEGESINWDEVDAGYADWMSKGGLAPDRSTWQTSGFGSYTFSDYADIGFGDFDIDQLEGYYCQFYVDPGYIYYAPISLGFIGYYIYDGKVMSTSPFWLTLEAGDLIDWDAVDAGYADWMAKGGLEPDRTLWQTSGYASFAFTDYAPLGYSDFTGGQLESYYQAFYVDPGYINYAPVNLGFIGHYLNNGNVLSTSFYWQTLGAGDFIDWDAVDAAYADWVAKGGLVPDRSQWKTSGPATFYFDDYALIGYNDFTGGQLETYYGQFFVAPKYFDPAAGDDDDDDTPCFDIGIYKLKTGQYNEVFIDGNSVGFMKVETAAFEYGGYNIIITLNDRGKGNDTWIYDFTYEVVKL